MKKMIAGILVGAGLLLMSGCNLMSGGDKESSILIEKDKAEELEVELNIGAGKLEVTDGAKDWVEGSIQYDKKKLKPDISYKLRGEEGKAVIEQEKKGFTNIGIGDVKNDWKLALTNDIPVSLAVNAGASDTELDLKGMQLSSLEVNAGVGDMEVDLSGDWKESFDVKLAMGVGESTIILPENVGVKISASKGIGNANFEGLISKGNGIYVNKAYEGADVVINIQSDLGVGEANFKLNN